MGQGGDNTKGQLVDFSVCPNDADWIAEKGAGNNFTSCYEIMWDDGEYGNDFDLDIRYRLYVKDDGVSSLTVRTKAIYANSGHTNWTGFYINGVTGGAPGSTGSGEYYEIRCGGSFTGISPSNTDCDKYDGTETAVNTRTFTVTGTNAGLLKDPLWYAAKYGGFKDSDKPATTGYNLPDKTAEWDVRWQRGARYLLLCAKPIGAGRETRGCLRGDSEPDFVGNGGLRIVLVHQWRRRIVSILFLSDTVRSRTGNQVYRLCPWALCGFLRKPSRGYQWRWSSPPENEDRIVVTRYDAINDRLVVDIYADTNGDGKADPSRDAVAPFDGVFDTAVCDDSPHQCDKPSQILRRSGKGVVDWQLCLLQTGAFIPGWISIAIKWWVRGFYCAEGEFVSFDTTNQSKIAGYLNLSGAPAAYTAANVINFIRGTQITGLRDRMLTVKDDSGTPTSMVWKLGDSVYSTPVVVAGPKERYDILYGDASYVTFYQQYKNRRQVAYLGANDGMMHAFNVGFYNKGDDPSTTGTNEIEHGWFSNTTTADGRGVNRGDELWSFIPQELLPHLRWLADPSYTHVYYVDLKPKITDARIFTADADHPGGWGTILIGGFRMGGSCNNCTGGQATPMSFTGDFNNDGSVDAARTFFSAYFVLDITNPEKLPTLLWSYSDTNLGLTMSYPSVVRVRPLGGDKTLEQRCPVVCHVWVRADQLRCRGRAGRQDVCGELERPHHIGGRDDGDDLRCWWNNIESTQLVRRRPRIDRPGFRLSGGCRLWRKGHQCFAVGG